MLKQPHPRLPRSKTKGMYKTQSESQGSSCLQPPGAKHWGARRGLSCMIVVPCSGVMDFMRMVPCPWTPWNTDEDDGVLCFGVCRVHPEDEVRALWRAGGRRVPSTTPARQVLNPMGGVETCKKRYHQNSRSSGQVVSVARLCYTSTYPKNPATIMAWWHGMAWPTCKDHCPLQNRWSSPTSPFRFWETRLLYVDGLKVNRNRCRPKRRHGTCSFGGRASDPGCGKGPDWGGEMMLVNLPFCFCLLFLSRPRLCSEVSLACSIQVVGSKACIRFEMLLLDPPEQRKRRTAAFIWELVNTATRQLMVIKFTETEKIITALKNAHCKSDES